MGDDILAKNKKVVIVDEELTPTVLYTKKEKKGSIIWLILIFAIFIAVVIYLPDITLYIDEYLNPTVNVPVTPSNPNNDNPNDDEDAEEVTRYELTTDLQITEDNFTLSNFVVTDSTISFRITNTGTELLDFSELNYFLELYNANRMLLQRIMVSDQIIAAGSGVNVSYDITNSSITIISFLEIASTDYPAHVLEADDSGNATMTCTKGYETVTYAFTDNLVYAIEDLFTVATTDPNYSTLYSSYQALAATYNTIGGLNSTVSVLDNNLTFRTTINLAMVSEGTFNNVIYYPRNTDAKIINFELESNGYTCN